MKLRVDLKNSFFWLLIGTLSMSTIQISVVDFQADENSWFHIFTTLVVNKENEDAGVEKELKTAKEYTVFNTEHVLVNSNKYFQPLKGHQLYFAVLREVFSSRSTDSSLHSDSAISHLAYSTFYTDVLSMPRLVGC